jgi:hypothetical protein
MQDTPSILTITTRDAGEQVDEWEHSDCGGGSLPKATADETFIP